jgi:hypothetical protein
VGPGDDQRVPVEDGPVVQESHEVLVFQDEVGGKASVDDTIEHTV